MNSTEISQENRKARLAKLSHLLSLLESQETEMKQMAAVLSEKSELVGIEDNKGDTYRTETKAMIASC
jgi:DNA-directed RNA polymerase specialized sigma54-like protein